MPALSKKIIFNIKDNIVSFSKDTLFIFALFIITFKSIYFLGFISGSNHLKTSFTGGFNSIYSPGLFCFFILGIVSFSYLLKGRSRVWFFVLFNVLFSVILLIDLWYYRAFGTFVSPHLLKQTTNLNNLEDSIFSMMSIWDIPLIIDIPILIFVFIKYRQLFKGLNREVFLFLVFFTVSMCFIFYIPFKVYVLGISDKRSYYFDVTWRPDLTMYHLSPIGYHIFDTYVYWKDCQPLKLDNGKKGNIERWFDEKKENLPDNQYKGLLKGKNLIILQVESLENFVLNQKIDNQEITPTLNRLSKNSIYFSNIYEQVHNGTSSDSDFLVNTSVYPIRRGSTFFRYPRNTYNSLPKLLEDKGYSTTAIHPDKGSYWNWMEALTSIGFQKCIDSTSFAMDEVIGLGLSDSSYLKQVEPVIQKLKQPFYVFMVTLTSHTPFKIPDKYKELTLPDGVEKTKLGGYFHSLRYTDKQIGIFLSKLDQSGLLNNTVVVIIGDHTGVHKFYPTEVKKATPSYHWWSYNSMQVPFMVYQKNLKETQISIKGGQVDILPTVLYLMGVDEKNYENTAMGRNLLKTDKDFAVLATGNYVGEEKSKKDLEHATLGLDIADLLIRSNYFKDYRK
ncbi:MAG: LTA synthase family protein [Clostridia bacterium]|nr:LTA synthase family protein [Clostridia bacterium]